MTGGRGATYMHGLGGLSKPAEEGPRDLGGSWGYTFAPLRVHMVCAEWWLGMSQSSVSSATRAKVARSVLKKNMQLKPGERVIVEAWTHTLPWAVTFAREVRKMGAQVLVPYEDEEAYWDAVDAGEDRLLGKIPAHEWAALAKTNVYIHMWGPGDRIRLNKIPEARRNGLFEFNNQWYAAARKAGVRGARLEIGRPYPTLVKAYKADEGKWMDELVRGTMVSPDSMARTASPIARALSRGKRLRIHDDRGTDLTLGLLRRPVRVDIGRLTPAERKRPFNQLVTLPSGAVSLALDETVADGTIVGNRTDYYDDAVATGVTFQFRRGKLTHAEFEEGGNRFKKEFKNGRKGRDRPGQLRIGLNPELHNTPQLEDRELGAVMVSLGSNDFYGGKNTAQFFQWVINAGAAVEVDGKALALGR
jgi:leucyl aminopeptidase (aminopeptidase T)